MAPIELQGKTLGEKHKYYNEMVKDTIEKNPFQNLTNISYDESDLNNIFKIDMASSNKNYEYILEVLKCEDMFYISRAIKKSVWLITDEKYSHIINPEYLHAHLFPQMTSKAINKFNLYIRLNLKNENRVEAFFNYYKNVNLEVALKWLPNSSLQVIEKAIKTYGNKIKISLLKRLCEKSITILEIYIKDQKQYNKRQIMNASTFFINEHLEKYLDLIEILKDYEVPDLGAKQTKTIMKDASTRILKNFEKYADHIHLPTFVKFFRPEDIKNFLLEHRKNEKLQNWFRHDNLKPFILVMPQENRLEFVKMLLIDKKDDDSMEECEDENSDVYLCCAGDSTSYNSPNSYIWYKYAPFKTAFADLKKIIRAESSPSERISMLEVLLCSARRNMQHIQTLLQYFRNKHINEPYKFKIKFINAVLKQMHGSKFNDSTWQNLNELFCSIEVYSESKNNNNNNLQFCIIVAIVHKILNSENVPEILENKFSFQTLKAYRRNLNQNDCEKIFSYLYNIIIKKLNEKNVDSESELRKRFNVIENVLQLLSDWDKDLLEFPLILDTIQELIRIKKTNSWNVNLPCLYNIKKSWRKHLFSVSLDLWPSQEACMNALKHDPELLLTSKNILEFLYRDDSIVLKQFLNKIRIYWSSSLADECISFLCDQLNRKSDNKALIRHLFVLLPQKDFLDVVKKYVPKEEKINWNESDKLLLDIQKNVANCIHIARPQASLEVVLWYAKGDYLQFAIPSLMAILSNMSCTNTEKHIKVLIAAPVSLQKHGIRIAVHHMKSEEVIQMFSSAWKNTKNRSIRADLFKSTFKLLCKEKKVCTIETIWTLLDDFIDKLTDAENKTIYDTLTKVDQVPLCVRVAFWKKSLQFLKTLPPKSISNDKIQRVISSAREFMDIVDVDFIAEILLENLKKNFTIERLNNGDIISSCLLSVKNSELQLDRYKKIFFPIMELCVESWNKKHENEYFVRSKFCDLLKNLCQDFKNFVLQKKMVIPLNLFNEINCYLIQNLPIEENYTLLRAWKFTTSFINIINLNVSTKTHDKMKEFSESDTKSESSYNHFNVAISKSIPKFGEKLLEYLKDDSKLFYPSIYLWFGEAVQLMWNFFYLDYSSELEMLNAILNSDVIESYLLVLYLIPSYLPEENKEKRTEILGKILSHPSPEIKMHCYRYIERSYLKNL